MGRRGVRLAALAAGTFALGGIAACSPDGGAEVEATGAGEATSPALGDEVAWNHDPASENGPDRWGELDPSWAACGDGSSQSPIALEGAEPADLPPLVMDYESVPLVVENTGHTVEVPQPAEGGGTLQVGSDTYTLLQWHVHAPSEHVLDEQRFDMEIHLVHGDADGGTAVVALLADGTPADGAGDDPTASATGLTLRTLLDNAPEEADEETDTGLEASVGDLLPFAAGEDGTAQTRNYLTYDGSLTTPPCTEGVRWFVLTPELAVSDASVEVLHDLIAEFPGYAGFPDNDRPLQPTNEREIRQPTD